MKLTSYALAVVLLAATAALGDVIPRHDPSIVTPPGGFVTGTGNLLYDSETNLEWLDVTLTKGISTDAVVGGGTPTMVGLLPSFRFATSAEVAVFWTHAAIRTPNLPPVEQSAQIMALQSEWGVTSAFGAVQNTDAYVLGITEGGFHPGVLLGSNSGVSGVDQALVDNVILLHPHDAAGSALVRTSVVPEPSSYALAGMAFVVVGAWASIRRRSKRLRGSPLPSVPSA